MGISVMDLLMVICVMDELMGIVESIETLYIELMNVGVAVVMMSNMMVMYCWWKNSGVSIHVEVWFKSEVGIIWCTGTVL